MLLPVLVTPPVEAVISLAEAREQCRVTGTDSDALLSLYIGAATEQLDGYSGLLGRCLVTQTWRQDFLCWAECLRLPFPGSTVTALTYYDVNDAEQTVAAGNYRVFEEAGGPVLRFSPDWSFPPLTDENRARVSVTFSAGFGGAADVPARIKTAIRLHVQALYDAEDEAKWRPAYESAIAPYRPRRL